MQWTDQQVELMIRLWNQGKTPSQIAARLVGLGRDAVLEKLHLLALDSGTPRTMSIRRRRSLQVGRISGGQHSFRFRAALCEHARQRAVGRTGYEDSRDGSAAREHAASGRVRQARLLAALLALDSGLRPQPAVETSTRRHRSGGSGGASPAAS